MSPKLTKEISIGKIKIGGNHRIAIQSMTNTKTKDIQSTIAQIKRLEMAGCDIVRVAVLDLDDAHAISEIKRHISIPIVADIHFDYRLALAAIEAGVDKLRINPGNIGSIDKIAQVVCKCKAFHIPIRIGVNLGSLEQSILDQYGRTAKGLVESARRHVQILESLKFHDIVLSLKASDVAIAVEAYQLASEMFDYPLHIGITEAGSAFGGTIKSAVGLGILLHQGIGQTIRVSLSADPVEEIRVAKEILATLGYFQKPVLISCPSCGRLSYDMFPIIDEIEAYMATLPNIPIKIAIMGCAVNGPGEAKEADIGIAGGHQEALLFKKGLIDRKIKQEDIVSVLKYEIDALIKEKSS